MFSNSWKRCFPAVFGLFLCGLAGSLHAQNAPFPVGNWGGHPYGVDNYPVYLSVYSSGTCTYREPNSGVALIGRCTCSTQFKPIKIPSSGRSCGDNAQGLLS